MSARKIFIALFVVALLAGACTREEPEGAGPGVSEEVQVWLDDMKARFGGTTVKLAMAAHPSTDAFQTYVEEFEKATDIDVVFDVMEEGALGEKEVLECGRQGDTYDIYMTAVEGVAAFAATGCEEPIDDLLADEELTPAFYDYEDIMPAYRDLFVVDGKPYAIPFAGESVFLIYRKDLFEAVGKQPPSTWQELAELAKFFDEQGEVSGVAFRARKGWEFTYTYSIFMFPFGGRIVDPETGTPLLDTPGNAAALQYMIDLKDYAPTGMESFSFPEAWGSMQTGEVAMLVEATAAAPELENPDKSVVAGKLGYAPLPAGPDGSYTGVWGWGLGINAHSQNRDAAWAVIVWLTGKQNGQRYLDAGGVVSRASSFEDPKNQEQYPYFAGIREALDQAANLTEKGLATVPKLPQWFELSDVIGGLGSEAFVGQRPVGEALEQMQAQAQEILAG